MKKTPLNELHHRLGAKMIDFGGWEMPVQYTSIIAEHQNVRQNCGLFDVSHMGEILIQGNKALDYVQKIVTNNAARLADGQILYTPMCYPDGGIIDDLLVYRFNGQKYLLVVNAANTAKDFEWIKENAPAGVDVQDLSPAYAQLALQGPKSRDLLAEITELDLAELKYYWFREGKVGGVEVILSRTGYTGELGYELYLAPEQAVKLWEEIMTVGEKYGLSPVGLGARDTLRLEKGYCLYGNDIDEKRNPLEAGLAWTVKLDKEDFFGKEALLKVKEEGLKEKLMGFKLTGRGIARHGYKLALAGQEIGLVTSGSFAPSLQANIGLGYIKKEYARVGQEIEVLIRQKPVSAQVVELPFI